MIIGFASATDAAAAGTSAAAGIFSGVMGLVCSVYAFFFLLIFALAIAGLAAVIWALYMVITAKNESNWKILWALIVLLTGIIGAALYYFLGHKERQA
jgi:hypothetical protein